MRSAAVIISGLLVLVGCGESPDVVTEAADPPPSPYNGPLDVPIDKSDNASPMERSGAAARALECDRQPYGGDAVYYNEGLASAQESAERALANFFDEEWYVSGIPTDGYVIERNDNDRVLFSYDVAGKTKVAIVAADGIRDFQGDTGWGIEVFAQCDPSEFPADVTDALHIQVWVDEAGARLPLTTVQSYNGPEHCGWQDATFIILDEGTDGEIEYVGDPSGELDEYTHGSFRESAQLPGDAVDTGYRHDGRQLWLSKDGKAAYLVNVDEPADVRRLPASKDRIMCA